MDCCFRVCDEVFGKGSIVLEAGSLPVVTEPGVQLITRPPRQSTAAAFPACVLVIECSDSISNFPITAAARTDLHDNTRRFVRRDHAQRRFELPLQDL